MNVLLIGVSLLLIGGLLYDAYLVFVVPCEITNIDNYIIAVATVIITITTITALKNWRTQFIETKRLSFAEQLGELNNEVALYLIGFASLTLIPGKNTQQQNVDIFIEYFSKAHPSLKKYTFLLQEAEFILSKKHYNLLKEPNSVIEPILCELHRRWYNMMFLPGSNIDIHTPQEKDELFNYVRGLLKSDNAKNISTNIELINKVCLEVVKDFYKPKF